MGAGSLLGVGMKEERKKNFNLLISLIVPQWETSRDLYAL